jgi:V/A-type H+/Na+-transporting ATPase subunit K
MIKYGILVSNPYEETERSSYDFCFGSSHLDPAPSDAGSSKLIGAGMAFGLAALGAGIGLGFVGAAGLAAISDNPKMQSRVFIIVGMVESIAIYGIVMMFIILGQ